MAALREISNHFGELSDSDQDTWINILDWVALADRTLKTALYNDPIIPVEALIVITQCSLLTLIIFMCLFPDGQVKKISFCRSTMRWIDVKSFSQDCQTSKNVNLLCLHFLLLEAILKRLLHPSIHSFIHPSIHPPMTFLSNQ